MSWWQDAISQAFNPPVEPGVDVGTAFHTPITALAPGKIVSETFGGFGARVDVQTGPKTIEYYQHLDTIASGLRVGSLVDAGQVLGLSGGQLSGGNMPNSPANSTGPHVEFGVLNSGKPVDPSATLRAGPAAGGVGSGPVTDPTAGFWAGLQNAIIGGGQGFFKYAPGGVFPQLAGQAAKGTDPASQVGTALGGAAGAAENWTRNNIIPLVVAGLIILVVLGTGQKTVQAPAPQVVPVPV